MLPLYVQLAAKFKDYQFAIAATPSISPAYYKLFTENTTVKIVYDETYDLLQHSSAALVTSGTATLETALFQVPQLVCYKSSYLSYWIARKILKLKYISLVNLILDREVVLELIQGQCNLNRLEKELNHLLNSKDSSQQEQYQQLASLLGSGGVSDKTNLLSFTKPSVKKIPFTFCRFLVSLGHETASISTIHTYNSIYLWGVLSFILPFSFQKV